ncbi:outer membrane protein assembly factor BamA [Flectobacillus rivi]|uniref:Outer membrane protein assembly factor BamA n=1 Tax=Flectobacillus rivi TaxID=2984209 RepID=A0ABT6Z317_9BACT|nr:outer membrane protein assembly factor BamA [Flectobacillus rivi]MDI9875523.1 outer membrane protein assembly factor BamA [Flectobacillus rivi]
MKKYSFLFCLTLLSFITQAQLRFGGMGRPATPAQTELNYASPQEYEIADIVVTGSKFYDGNSMITLSGLRVGDKIKVPGDAVSSAIKKLMDQGILEEVEVQAAKIEGDKIWLVIHLKERPRLFRIEYNGIRKGEQETLSDKIKTYKGKIITATVKKNIELAIKKHYQEKGYLNVGIKIAERTDTLRGNNATMKIYIKKGDKVKISKIEFDGVSEMKLSTLKRKLKGTKEKKFWRIFTPSKYVPKKFEEDKGKLIEYYNKKGYRDAQILKDSVFKDSDKTVKVIFRMEEGRQYHYRNIFWEGNYIYPDSVLTEILGVKRGDIYNTEDLEKRLNGKPQEDVSSAYMDNGYLYFQCEPVETAVVGDSIDITFRITEGKQATINKVIVNGNTKTSDHVVMREIRTLPGQKFNKSAIIRTVRELSTIGYFNPEKITPNPIPKADGTVDIEYNVEEKPSDQIELSGGWGGYIGFVGTLGVTFNNFSAKNIGNWESWKPLPSGDGQKLSVRFQANGVAYQNYSLSFTEPWLGGKKPNSFSVTLSRNISYPYKIQQYNYLSNPYAYGSYGYGYGYGYGTGTSTSTLTTAQQDSATTAQNSAHFNSTSLSFSLGKRLKWPDDYFSLSNSLSLSLIDIAGLGSSYYGYPEGKSLSIAFVTNLSRNSIDNPTFPRYGSSFSLTASLTPPYSLISGNTNSTLIEYHKWMFDASWFTAITSKLVFHMRTHMGFLGSYNPNKAISVFERFDVGGSGMMTGYTIASRDIIGLRGYKDRILGSQGTVPNGGVAYNKFVMEMRYPVSLNPSATIFLLAFAEGGNNFANYQEYNPFKLYKSAGVGARIFMPAFGMIGIDYGWAFDKVPGVSDFGRQAFTFSIGQQIR